MTTAPVVELGFNPTDLRPRDLPRAGAFLGSPAEALEAALAVARAAMVDQVKDEVRGIAEPTEAQLLRITDLAWQVVFHRYRVVSAPIIADAYIRAYRRADAGDVPMSLVYNLADKHAEKVGDYFHTSSRGALADGFTTLVNRRVPAKAAADRVLDGYGLTPRQMRTLVSAKQFVTPVDTPVPRSLKAKARAYIDKAFTTRIRKLSQQEEHNIDQQAQQFAWMWLQDKGRLNEKAQKLWITAKDERVCEICGPLHGKKVGVNEQFQTSHGEFWTPGLHPNCRCVVRLLEHRFSKADWDPEEHPRGGDTRNKGRFSRKAAPTVKERGRPVIALPGSSIFEQLQETEVEPEEREVPEEKVRLGTGEKVRLESRGGPVRLSGPVRISEPVRLGSKVRLGEESKARLGEETTQKTRLTPAEVREKVSLRVTPQMRIRMDTALTSVLQSDAQRVGRPRPLKRYLKRTLKIQDAKGNQHPVYAVVDPVDVAVDQEGRMELTHELVFSPNFSEVAAQAYDRFEETIQSVYDDVYYNEAHQLRSGTLRGTRWSATVDDETILSVISWKAYQGRVTDSDSAGGNPEATLTWVDPNGAEWEKQYRYSEIATMLHLSDEDFNIKILRLDEGHESNLGSTVQASAGSKYGKENWQTSGPYQAEPVSIQPIHHNLQMGVWQLEPEAEEEEQEFNITGLDLD